MNTRLQNEETMSTDADKNANADENTIETVPSLGLMEWEPTARGVLVKRVGKFSSLGRGGVVAGDEILAVGDAPIATLTDGDAATAFLQSIGIGQTVAVRLVRGGEEQRLEVKILARKKLSLDLSEVEPVVERKIAPAA